MWILLLVTTINIEQYEFKQVAVTKTMTECIRMIEKHQFEDSTRQQIYCIKGK